MKVEQVNRVVTYELANVHYIFVRESSHASRGYAKSRMDDTKNRLFSIN